jgi:hypothetical protein
LLLAPVGLLVRDAAELKKVTDQHCGLDAVRRRGLVDPPVEFDRDPVAARHLDVIRVGGRRRILDWDRR